MLRNLIALIFLAAPLAAQTIHVYPTGPIAPPGSDQTITAFVNGTNDKTVTWSTTGGTLVGTNPCVVNEPCTIALRATSGGPYTVTATANAGSHPTATSVVTLTATPSPSSTYPRLLLTPAIVTALQAKTTAGNPQYQAIRSAAITMYNNDNTIWSWTCNGGTGLPSSFQPGHEFDARYFAFMALVDPSDPTYHWGCYGRDIWTYTEGIVISGAYNIIGNTWSDTSVNFAVDNDWLMGSGSLSPADQTLGRQFLYFLMKTTMNYFYGISTPVTPLNSPTLTGNAIGNMRTMGNNYTMSKMMLLVAAGLTFNDNTTDDPPLTNTCSATRYQVCPDFSAGSLHAYWTYFAGSMLYLDWAHLDDPSVVQQAYNAAFSNVPSQPTCLYTDGTVHQCFGDGRDGQSSEGSWYQYSMYKLKYAMTMMHTAGYDDPILYGPQISLGTSSWWDLKYVNDLEMFTSMAPNNGPAGGGCPGCISPAFSYLHTGDSNTYFKNMADLYTEAAMLSGDTAYSRTDRSSPLEWSVLNSAYGGPAGTTGGCNAWCGYVFGLNAISTEGVVAMDMMIALPAIDPTISPPADPRPSLPTDWYGASYAQQQIVRTGWTGTDTLVSTYCANTLIDHEHEFCGRFDVFSNGEFITVGRTEFDDYNDSMSTTIFQNELSLTNTTGTGCNPVGCFVYPAVAYGGQWWHGQQAGFMTPLHSELPAYAATSVDNTLSYNGWFVFNIPYNIVSYNDVQSASRDILWLRGTNQVVYYDRGVTGASSDKSLSLNTTGAPTIVGNSATWLTRSGTQKASYTSFLGTGTLTNVRLPNSTTITATNSNVQTGTTQQFTCTANNADGTTTNLTSSPFVQWSSNNPGVATINSTGLMTAVGVGNVYITCLPYGLVTNALVNVISGSSAGPAVNVTGDQSQLSDWEPYTRLQRDAGNTTSSQFGSVLQWGASGFTPATVTSVSSSAGQTFDGALVGTAVVMFMRAPTAFTGTTYPASAATVQYVADLAPNTSYPITGTGTPGSATTDSAGVLTFAAAGTGNITVGTSLPPAAPTNLQGVVLIGATVR